MYPQNETSAWSAEVSLVGKKRSACVADRFFYIYRTKKGIAKVVVLTICNTTEIVIDFVEL